VAVMHKVLLMLLLCVVNSNAIAEWVKIGFHDDITSYANSESITRSGVTVKMWYLYDFDMPKQFDITKTFKSAKAQNEFDCKEEQSRRLVLIAYSGNMGSEDVIKIDNKVGKWSPIVPDSILESLFDYACGKK
jgi:hypothetical protein